MGKDAVTIPDEVRPLLERMADQLSEQIFPGGMPLVVLHNSGWVLAIYASQKKMVTLGD